MDTAPYEIERKFLIRRPNELWLSERAECSEIIQTYLVRPEGGGRARIRARTHDGLTVYTHTIKRRVNDLKALELEREIDIKEYDRLLKQADPNRRTLKKTRCCLLYNGQVFEIDLFPFWPDQALMEIELEDETQPIDFPPEIEIIREVTADKQYSNASLAKSLAQAEGLT